MTTATLPEVRPGLPALDWRVPQKVAYCIPLWLRDAQVRANIARISARIVPGARRTDPVAVVGFGPSLRDTWEQIRAFKYIISCSGSHKFLVERGIVPTWHVEVDPRPHKVALIGPPHPDTEYLIASACHAAVLDHLAGHKVTLWHIFDNSDDGVRLLPRGEWAITGGCDVGLRAMTIAGFLGFLDLHVFGMDQSAGTLEAPAGARHADVHPNAGAAGKFQPCEYGGVTYLTTPAMLEAARMIGHELDQMPNLRATFYGEGLAQAIARDYVPAPGVDHRPLANIIASARRPVISPEYRALNAQLHARTLHYGAGGARHFDVVTALVRSVAGIQSILDYGCGKGVLGRLLAEHNLPIWEYDPAIPGKDELPRPADLVVCTDVLEHVEPEYLAPVLDDLRRCVRKVGYFTIHTGPAKKTLPDGRNTHLIQRGIDWWRDKLGAYFVIGKILPSGPELRIIVGPKPVKRLKEQP